MSDISNTINVLLVDDQALLRQALANLLAQSPDLTIVGTASDGHEAIKQVAFCRPDVVILDIEMPNLDGLSATQLITQRFPTTKVIMLSSHDNEAYLMNAIKAGAKAYLLKDTLSDELTNTIRNVHKGYGQFGPGILEKMVAGIATSDTPSPEIGEEASPSVAPVEEDISAASQEQPLPLSASSSQTTPLRATLTAALSRFEPEELLTLIDQWRDQPETATIVRPLIEEALVETPNNLAALYLYGALARQVWNRPQIALKSLQTGIQAGIRQEMPCEALLLFYQEAVHSEPTVAFRWLTQIDSPWNTQKHLPFLIREAATQLGTASSHYKSLLLLYRMRSLKAMLRRQPTIHPSFSPSAAREQTSTIIRAT
ncbi:MAG: response regulator transcription factor [Leptolyngbya sp. SIO1E4]|nr:response regulator transcription factor [Leptolyngbya sp. SIO1E4]